ncbi:metalloregulator ArsR/SmtB family transcription factor [Leptolyngbya sp. FACHB-711]|uniref:ArsR/SmtB family transcription factor n=1 Tax=unclassified Leptolyngbya TaxID=2650499 RepID=UPI0016854207|nr:metalloregulator ArsR/SmtB family transcription factor [Leptolyngbya sp. FACHB-711]MBD1850133.1 helix-turn-helix transcriptional regulator [Cyanobacteria bacterium FACHB-502]MBD2026262.1 helix-turn-helix transcriptional regulator [Leptolyngbya sp. FACHB-711]
MDTEQRAKIFAALGDPTRLRIVERLTMTEGELSGSEIAAQLEISLALFCHHSKTLSEAGLLQTRKEGQTKFHAINRSLLKECFISLFNCPVLSESIHAKASLTAK